MVSALIVIDAPRFDLRLGVVDRCELVDIQTLITQSTVKRFDERIFHGFAGSNEIQLHAALIRQSSKARDMNSVP